MTVRNAIRRVGIVPAEMQAINLDVDGFYGKGARVLCWIAGRVLGTDRENRHEVIHGSEERKVPS
jgi:hypothetical protein